MCTLIYKAVHGSTPKPLRNLVTLRDTDTYKLLGAMKLSLPKVNTIKYGLNTLRYYGPKSLELLVL